MNPYSGPPDAFNTVPIGDVASSPSFIPPFSMDMPTTAVPSSDIMGWTPMETDLVANMMPGTSVPMSQMATSTYYSPSTQQQQQQLQQLQQQQQLNNQPPHWFLKQQQAKLMKQNMNKLSTLPSPVQMQSPPSLPSNKPMPDTNNAVMSKRIELILTINQEIIRLCLEHQQLNLMQREPDLTLYQMKLQSNLTYLATMADISMTKPEDQLKLPAPPDLSMLPTPFTPTAHKIHRLYETAQRLFYRQPQQQLQSQDEPSMSPHPQQLMMQHQQQQMQPSDFNKMMMLQQQHQLLQQQQQQQQQQQGNFMVNSLSGGGGGGSISSNSSSVNNYMYPNTTQMMMMTPPRF
ncbi:hypothetical protein V8B55DRAFT_1353115 [Mucor lusitanicus]|uniref:Uncharacterized protein n=1 Tax=Mucor lusitanicus CBS 277.49 TaxID=747725 RepID=A0A168I2X7_MUCCL|nr:hypothetical protein MUCCIDRAFT_92754 [Mucor lusitanicus CBS 277.49]